MARLILPTRLAQATEEMDPVTAASLERRVVERIRVSSDAVLGPHGDPDVFRAPDVETALQPATIVRRMGHARTEIWGASEWARCKDLARQAAVARAPGRS